MEMVPILAILLALWIATRIVLRARHKARYTRDRFEQQWANPLKNDENITTLPRRHDRDMSGDQKT